MSESQKDHFGLWTGAAPIVLLLSGVIFNLEPLPPPKCAKILTEDLPGWVKGSPDPRRLASDGDVLRNTRRCSSGGMWTQR